MLHLTNEGLFDETAVLKELSIAKAYEALKTIKDCQTLFAQDTTYSVKTNSLSLNNALETIGDEMQTRKKIVFWHWHDDKAQWLTDQALMILRMAKAALYVQEEEQLRSVNNEEIISLT